MSIEDAININDVHVVETAAPTSPAMRINWDWLKTETGEGDIEQYINHPLNFAKHEGLARIIRGVSGFVGHKLNFAIVDILLGLLYFAKKRTAA